MGEKTTIAWCDATFNTHWGCTKVSDGCTNCYAEDWAKRSGVKWGAGENRRFFGATHWADPIRWNRKAEKAGKRMRVFCGSMCDWADNEVDQSVREQLFALIRETPCLDWLLLTKRIGNVAEMLPKDWGERRTEGSFYRGGDGYPNVWLGITVVNQEEADRDIPKLVAIPARIRFLSIEPQLGRVDLCDTFGMWWNTTTQRFEASGHEFKRDIDWVINGGESGHHARPLDLAWARSLRDTCKAAGVAFFMKQGSGPRPGTPTGDPGLDSYKEFPC